MVTINLSLEEHWASFIQQEIASGRYNNVNDIISDALRNMEERKNKLDALKAHLSKGEKQALQKEFVTASLNDILTEFKTRESAQSV